MVTVEEAYLPMTLSAPGLTDAQFQEFCEQYADFRLEYTAEGELIVMPPTDPETSARNALDLTFQLTGWASKKRGVGSPRTPPAASCSPTARGSPRMPRGFRAPACAPSSARNSSSSCFRPRTAPRKAHAKMLEWIENGVELGWLIDPKKQAVTVYRPGPGA